MQVAPSILTADYTVLGETLDEAIDAGIKWIHLDVMDGNWVVNKTITFGPDLSNLCAIESVKTFLSIAI